MQVCDLVIGAHFRQNLRLSDRCPKNIVSSRMREHFIVDIWLWRNIKSLNHFPNFWDTKEITTAQFQQKISQLGEIIFGEAFWDYYSLAFTRFSVETQWIEIRSMYVPLQKKISLLCAEYLIKYRKMITVQI